MIIKDNINLKQAVFIVGTVLLVVGIITGFLPVGGGCGSAFAGSSPYSDGAGSCALYRGEAVRSAWQFIIGGVLLMLIAPAVAITNIDRAAMAPRQVHGGPPLENA